MRLAKLEKKRVNNDDEGGGSEVEPPTPPTTTTHDASGCARGRFVDARRGVRVHGRQRQSTCGARPGSRPIGSRTALALAASRIEPARGARRFGSTETSSAGGACRGSPRSRRRCSRGVPIGGRERGERRGSERGVLWGERRGCMTIGASGLSKLTRWRLGRRRARTRVPRGERRTTTKVPIGGIGAGRSRRETRGAADDDAARWRDAGGTREGGTMNERGVEKIRIRKPRQVDRERHTNYGVVPNPRYLSPPRDVRLTHPRRRRQTRSPASRSAARVASLRRSASDFAAPIDSVARSVSARRARATLAPSRRPRPRRRDGARARERRARRGGTRAPRRGRRRRHRRSRGRRSRGRRIPPRRDRTLRDLNLRRRRRRRRPEGRERRGEGVDALPGRVPLRITRRVVIVVRGFSFDVSVRFRRRSSERVSSPRQSQTETGQDAAAAAAAASSPSPPPAAAAPPRRPPRTRGRPRRRTRARRRGSARTAAHSSATSRGGSHPPGLPPDRRHASSSSSSSSSSGMNAGDVGPSHAAAMNRGSPRRSSPASRGTARRPVADAPARDGCRRRRTPPARPASSQFASSRSVRAPSLPHPPGARRRAPPRSPRTSRAAPCSTRWV